jgi:hypothetical protein
MLRGAVPAGLLAGRRHSQRRPSLAPPATASVRRPAARPQSAVVEERVVRGTRVRGASIRGSCVRAACVRAPRRTQAQATTFLVMRFPERLARAMPAELADGTLVYSFERRDAGAGQSRAAPTTSPSGAGAATTSAPPRVRFVGVRRHSLLARLALTQVRAPRRVLAPGRRVGGAALRARVPVHLRAWAPDIAYEKQHARHAAVLTRRAACRRALGPRRAGSW